LFFTVSGPSMCQPSDPNRCRVCRAELEGRAGATVVVGTHPDNAGFGAVPVTVETVKVCLPCFVLVAALAERVEHYLSERPSAP